MKSRYLPVALFVIAGLAVLLVPLPAAVKGLLYKTYNLVVFCYIVYLVAAPAVRDMFVERKKQVERHIVEARAAREQAETTLRLYQDKLKQFEQEKAGMHARSQEEAAQERQMIIEDARREAQRIIQQAKDVVLNESRRAQLALREEVIAASLRLSEDLLKQQYSRDDQKRAVGEVLARVGELRS
jgi:F-type H+-transporting ATPase subunit b